MMNYKICNHNYEIKVFQKDYILIKDNKIYIKLSDIDKNSAINIFKRYIFDDLIETEYKAFTLLMERELFNELANY